MKKRKFKQGNIITSLEVLATLLRGERYVYWHHKPLHHAFIRSMTFHTVLGAVGAGILREALPND